MFVEQPWLQQGLLNIKSLYLYEEKQIMAQRKKERRNSIGHTHSPFSCCLQLSSTILGRPNTNRQTNTHRVSVRKMAIMKTCPQAGVNRTLHKCSCVWKLMANVRQPWKVFSLKGAARKGGFWNVQLPKQIQMWKEDNTQTSCTVNPPKKKCFT